MVRCLRFVLFGAALLGVCGATVRGYEARSSKQIRLHNTSVTITVPPSAFDPATGLAVVLVPRALLAEVRSSKPWTLRVRSDRANLSNSSGDNDKPCSDVAIRASNLPGFRALSTAPTPVLSGVKTRGWIDVAFDVRFTARLTDTAGSYTLNLTFDFN